MATMKRLVPLVLPLLLACGSSGEQSAHEQDNAARERAFHFSGGDTLAQRASFDLNCPPNMMAAQVLQRAGMFAVAVAVGVRGCGRQTTYVRGPGTAGAWVLNGPVTADPAFQPPPNEPPPPPPPPAQ
jgi:hypothetical protein